MPSVNLSSRIEKQGSLDSSQEPLKQVHLQVTSLIEKKLRNLEKRKTRLEQLKEEQKSGKELNDDQKNAVKRHDQVIEMLDIFKEFHKNVSTIFSEHNKLMKKAAKKEQLERQQQEIERIKSVILYQDILNNMGGDEVRNDFVHGTNRAQKLEEVKLNNLDEIFKLVSPDRSITEEPFEKQVSTAAERYYNLTEGKAKPAFEDVTYKDLKDLILSIHESAYFNQSITPEVNIGQGGDTFNQISQQTTKPEEESNVPRGVAEFVSNKLTGTQNSSQPSDKFGSQDNTGAQISELIGQMQQQPTLAMGTGFNFLQESRIDLEGHTDPAVVAMGTYSAPYGPGTNTQDGLTDAIGQIGIPMTQTSNQKVPYGNAASHQPIPTQTFTNQSFATTMFVPAVTIAPNMGPIAAVGLPVAHIPQQGQMSPHNTSSDMMLPQDQNQHQHQISQSEQMQHQNYTNQGYNDYQSDRATSQEKTFADDTAFGSQSFGRGGGNYRPRRGGRGSNVNGYPRQGSSRPGGNRSYQGGYGYGNNSMNGQNYSNVEKRNPSINQYGNKTQSNRGGVGRYGDRPSGNRNVPTTTGPTNNK